MQLLHLALGLAALAPTVVLAAENEFDYMYFPDLERDAGGQALAKCVVHANDHACHERNTEMQQRHNVSTWAKPLRPVRRALYDGRGSYCYNMQHGEEASTLWHDTNLCDMRRRCPWVPRKSMWVIDDACRAAPFKAIMAFTGKNCVGDVTVWDMDEMVAGIAEGTVIGKGPRQYCMQMDNSDDGPKIGSFQFLDTKPA